METFHVRQASQSDAGHIAEFNRAMARETENRELIPNLIEAGVNSLMENPALGFYVVTESDDTVVACLMVTSEWSDWRNGLFWWIQSVYVSPDYRRRGIYRRMYQFVKELANENSQVCGFRLYVERENANAKSTYTSLGMEETPYRLYEEIKSGAKCFLDVE